MKQLLFFYECSNWRSGIFSTVYTLKSKHPHIFDKFSAEEATPSSSDHNNIM